MLSEQMMPQNPPKNEDPESSLQHYEDLSPQEAERIRKDGSALLYQVYEHIGDEDYAAEIVQKLYKSYFSSYSPEHMSQHIMYRVIVGTSISEQETGTFVYNDSDAQVEKILRGIALCPDLITIDQYLRSIDGMFDSETH